jgi:hypothetical protein
MAQFSRPSGFAQFLGPLGSGLGSYLVKSPSHLYLRKKVSCYAYDPMLGATAQPVGLLFTYAVSLSTLPIMGQIATAPNNVPATVS